MTASKRPTRLLEDTPSMQWADHVEASRRTKIGVAIAAVAVNAVMFVVILILALNGGLA